jgi:membrane associated rhomboid family serine protease
VYPWHAGRLQTFGLCAQDGWISAGRERNSAREKSRSQAIPEQAHENRTGACSAYARYIGLMAVDNRRPISSVFKMKHSESRALDDPREDSLHMKRSFTTAASFVAVLWVIKAVETIYVVSFAEYGIYPGRLSGLAGILLAPLIHSSYTHLFANTLPLLVLGTTLLYGYPKSARIVLPAIYFGTGLCVWLFARHAYHIGASGLAFGFMFFVFTVGAIRWDRRAIALSMIVFFLYGSMIWGIFPTDPDISYESHFFGAMIGIILAVLLRNHDPRPPEKRYSWEEDEETDPESVDEPPDGAP